LMQAQAMIHRRRIRVCRAMWCARGHGLVTTQAGSVSDADGASRRGTVGLGPVVN
jgi:hypothetical protein